MINRLEVIAVLLVLGLVGVHPTPCAEVTCPPLSFDIGTVYDPNLSIGSTATFECPPNFFVDGAETSMCQANGQWSSSPPTCTHIQCPVPSIENGEFVPVGDLYPGTEVTFHCHEHFELKGSPTIKCQETGVWTESYPVCVPILCPMPVLENGDVSYTGLAPGGVADFQCHEGFALKGTPQLTCQDNGDWSGSYPICAPILCPTPMIENGQGAYTGIKPGDTVDFSCFSGFELKGDSHLTCGPNGDWVGNYPICTPILCPEPFLDDGQSSYSGRKPGDYVDFSCHSGFELKGDSHLTCGPNGDWVGNYPVCTPILCPAPVLENGQGAYSGIKPGDTVDFSCFSGFELKGDAHLTCGPNGDWVGNYPVCTPILCPEPFLDDGQASYSGRKPGDYVDFTCHSGFELMGDSHLTCGPTGDWAGNYPVCVPIRCPMPELGDGTLTITGDLKPGSKADFVCNAGFELKGAAELTCQADGDWSDSYPVCTPIHVFCHVLDVENGVVTYNGERVPGGIANFACAPGYVLQGSPSAKCLDSGQWDVAVPTCVIVTCPPIVLANGSATYYPDTQPPIFGESVCFACQECGYKLEGPDGAWCQADGTWSAQPTCVPVYWGCTRTQGYWSTHVCEWPVPFVPGLPVKGKCTCDSVARMLIGTNLYSQCDLISVLLDTSLGNALRSLAAQLIAAKINVMRGVITCFPVVGTDPLNIYNGLTVPELIQIADGLIGGMTLVPMTQVNPSSALGQKMLWVKTLLDQFNNGFATVPHCV